LGDCGTPKLEFNFGPATGPFNIGVVTNSLTPSGGVPPYTFSYTPGFSAVPGLRVQSGQPLPTGFGGTGGLLGVAVAPGAYASSIRASDSGGHTIDRAITVTIQSIQLLSASQLPKATVGTPYSFTLTAT